MTILLFLSVALILFHRRREREKLEHTQKLKKRHVRETYSFLLLILNTSFCSSCTKRKNSLISALIIVDISIILIRSTLMCFFLSIFCSFVMTWLIELLRLLCSHTKNEGKYFPQQYLHNLYNYLFLCDFSVVWCKNFGIISKKRATKREKNGQEYYYVYYLYVTCVFHPQLNLNQAVQLQ